MKQKKNICINGLECAKINARNTTTNAGSSDTGIHKLQVYQSDKH